MKLPCKLILWGKKDKKKNETFSKIDGQII